MERRPVSWETDDKGGGTGGCIPFADSYRQRDYYGKAQGCCHETELRRTALCPFRGGEPENG